MTDVRVLHVISEMGIGGAESLVVEMVRRGNEFGWNSAVASGGGLRADELIREGVRHFFVKPARRSIRGMVSARSATARALKEFHPHVVIAHNVSASAVAWSARPNVPLLSVFHGVADTDYRNSARVLNRTSDRVVVVANAISDRLKAAGVRSEAITVIRNAVTPSAPVDRLVAREALGIPADVPVALCLARMEPQKRHDVLLDAWEQLSGGELLLLAGDGSLRPTLERRAQSLGDRVRFLGQRTDVPALLAATDVTVLTSEWEGLPMAVLESLAASRPVVATDVDGLREILGDGGGRLVPADSAAGIAAALRELLGDEQARSRAASIGTATIERAYDPATMMTNYDYVLRDVLRTVRA